jgi:LacI family transcriptional regulator
VRPARLQDVADLAGVHVATVSKALSGSPSLNIRPETRERILQAAAELHYRPNAVGRALRLASTGALGMLVPSLRNPVYAEIIRGAFERAWERGFVVLLAEDRGGGDAERAYERLVQQGRIDGLLIAGARPDSTLGETGPVPFVFVNRRRPGAHNVSMREEEAGALAARHLLELGHTRLAHIAGPEGIDTADRRAAGFKAEADARVVHAAFDERAGYEAMSKLLRARGKPTAVFTSNLNQAIGALAAADVPRDVSLLTYDDDPLCDYLSPPLTGIRMPLRELGAAGVDELLDRPGTAQEITLDTPPELILRASTRARVAPRSSSAPPPRARGGS